MGLNVEWKAFLTYLQVVGYTNRAAEIEQLLVQQDALLAEVERIKAVRNCHYECVSKAEADARIADLGEQLRQSQVEAERLRKALERVDVMACTDITPGDVFMPASVLAEVRAALAGKGEGKE